MGRPTTPHLAHHASKLQPYGSQILTISLFASSRTLFLKPTSHISRFIPRLSNPFTSFKRFHCIHFLFTKPFGYSDVSSGGFCGLSVNPSRRRFRGGVVAMAASGSVQKSEEEWRAVLSHEQFWILRQKGTDAPLMSSPIWARDFGSSEELITEFCRECGIVRKGLAGDSKKTMKDGKPIIIELLRPRLKEIKEEMQNKDMSPDAVADGRARIKELLKEYGVTPFTPLKGLLISGPIFCSFFFAVR